ncbi:MAG: hypothetical protein HY554_14110 [Elusimicrobia bacterium]|nr:hypothetical protein [Elusimicrobiota bacterium]
MKIESRTESRLVLVEPGPTLRHWGLFMLGLAGPALYVLLTSEGQRVMPAIWLSAGFLAAGLVAALFMDKRLRHVLDKEKDTLTIEYPTLMNTRLEAEVVPLFDVVGVRTEKVIFQKEDDSPHSNRYGSPQTGFSYALRGGKTVESGIYSSDAEEIEAAVAAVVEFLRLKG